MKIILTILIGLLSGFGSGYAIKSVTDDRLTLGAFGDPFISLQLATGPDSGEYLRTDGTNNSWATPPGGASVFGELGDTATSSDATGDVYYLNASGQIVNLGIGSADQVLKVSGGLPSWGADNAGSGAYSWTPLVISGVTYSATTSPVHIPLTLLSSSTIGRVTVGTLTATTSITGNLTGNADTATALAANGGNCSSGNAPLGVDASGAVESCFDVWTEAENTAAAYISDGNTGWDNSYGFITGIFTNPLSVGYLVASSSATSTFSGGLYGSLISAPYFHATSSTATSTLEGGLKIRAGGLSISGLSGVLKADSGVVNNAANGTDYTLITATTCSGTDKVSAITAAGAITCTTDETSAGGGTYAWTPSTSWGALAQATSSILAFPQALISSTTIGRLTIPSLTSTSTATSTFAGGVQSTQFNATTASSTFNGLVLSGGGAQIQTLKSCSNGVTTDASGTLICNTATYVQTSRQLTIAGTANQITSSAGAQDLSADRTWTLSFPSNITFPNSIFAHSASTTLARFSSTTIGQLTSGIIFATSTLQIPTGSTPVVDAIGKIALDTTDNQLLIATSTNASYPVVIPLKSRISFKVASTTEPFFTGFSSGKIIGLPSYDDGYLATHLTCSVWGGTSIVVTFTTGGADSNNVTCAVATSTTVLTSNNSVSALAGAGIKTGTVTGTPNALYVSVTRQWVRE